MTNLLEAETRNETLRVDWIELIRELGPHFAPRAMESDETDAFVEDNFEELKAAKVFSSGIPYSLGGGGASYREQCEMVFELGHHCGSTALALAMHFNMVSNLVWRWRHQQAPVEDLLRKVARDELVMVSSGGSDWLESSGEAELVDGGYRVTAHKKFCSGCPAGDILVTSAVYEDPSAGSMVLDFLVPLKNAHIKVVPSWHALGMRGTGSHDVLMEGVFVPAAAVMVQRPQGRWHASLHLAAKISLPMIYSVYLGIAEAARHLALSQVSAKRDWLDLQYVAGEMENELFAARLVLVRMVDLGDNAAPGPETTNLVLMARGLAVQSTIRSVEKAMELAGGRSFYRNLGLERLYRDVQAARFHPLPEKPQQRMAGRMALGLDAAD